MEQAVIWALWMAWAAGRPLSWMVAKASGMGAAAGAAGTIRTAEEIKAAEGLGTAGRGCILPKSMTKLNGGSCRADKCPPLLPMACICLWHAFFFRHGKSILDFCRAKGYTECSYILMCTQVAYEARNFFCGAFFVRLLHRKCRCWEYQHQGLTAPEGGKNE